MDDFDDTLSVFSPPRPTLYPPHPITLVGEGENAWPPGPVLLIDEGGNIYPSDPIIPVGNIFFPPDPIFPSDPITPTDLTLVGVNDLPALEVIA